MIELGAVKNEIRSHQSLKGKTVPFKKELRERILNLIRIEIRANREVGNLSLPLAPSTLSFLKRKAVDYSIRYEDRVKKAE